MREKIIECIKKSDTAGLYSILREDIDLKNIDDDGLRSFLSIACRRGSYEILKVLLENGLDPRSTKGCLSGIDVILSMFVMYGGDTEDVIRKIKLLLVSGSLPPHIELYSSFTGVEPDDIREIEKVLNDWERVKIVPLRLLCLRKMRVSARLQCAEDVPSLIRRWPSFEEITDDE